MRVPSIDSICVETNVTNVPRLKVLEAMADVSARLLADRRTSNITALWLEQVFPRGPDMTQKYGKYPTNSKNFLLIIKRKNNICIYI